jgi:Ni,Fe-hydrogenase III large subunit
VSDASALTTIVVGPVHAGIIEPGRFTFTSGGENVVRLDAQFGFSRRDVERRIAGRTIDEAAAFVARICGGCSASRSWAYACAVERAAGITLDTSVEFARIAVAELERLYNHVFDLASMCSGAGFAHGQMRGLRLKERVQRLCYDVARHRLLFDAIVPGGVRADLFPNRDDARTAVYAVRRELESYGKELFSTNSLVSRFESAGRVPHHAAHELDAVGPALRASGGTDDVRTLERYGAYAALVPAVTTLHEGDAAARARVKYAEALESLRLIDAALAELGDAPIASLQSLAGASGCENARTEGPRGEERVGVDFTNGRIEKFAMTAASQRNWPLVVRAMDGNIIPDFPLVNKSFNLCYACADK